MKSFVYSIMFFSDTNLEHDDFLKSLMDEHGWVPVSKLADFNRVCFLSRFLDIVFLLFCPCARKQLLFFSYLQLKKMTEDKHLILDALASSSVLEVQVAMLF